MKKHKVPVICNIVAVALLLVLLGSLLLNLSPVWFVVASALLGILLKNQEVKRA